MLRAWQLDHSSLQADPGDSTISLPFFPCLALAESWRKAGADGEYLKGSIAASSVIYGTGQVSALSLAALLSHWPIHHD